jgi:hypothetical protein
MTRMLRTTRRHLAAAETRTMMMRKMRRRKRKRRMGVQVEQRNVCVHDLTSGADDVSHSSLQRRRKANAGVSRFIDVEAEVDEDEEDEDDDDDFGGGKPLQARQIRTALISSQRASLRTQEWRERMTTYGGYQPVTSGETERWKSVPRTSPESRRTMPSATSSLLLHDTPAI